MIDLTHFRRYRDSGYLIDADGRVFSEKRNRLLAPSFNQSGHRICKFRMPNGVQRSVSVHRAVRELFGVKLHHLNREEQIHARQQFATEYANIVR